MRAAELLPSENKPAPGDLRFVQAFVNTLDHESGRDELARPEDLERWLRTHVGLDEGERLGPEDLRQATRFREALRTILTEGSEQDADALAVIDEVGARGSLRMATTVEGRLELEPVGADMWAALGRMLATVHHAMHDGTWERLKVCAADECRWVFYDASRNQTGAWCSMRTCGNRAKVRVHRARQRGEAA